MKRCKYCQSEIDQKAKICPNCKKDLRNYFLKHKVFTTILLLIVVGVIISNTRIKSNPSIKTSTEENKVANETYEENKGVDIELSPGKYIVGEDVVPGKYDVQAIKGMGNFFVYSKKVLGGLKVNQAFSENEDKSMGLFGSTYTNLNLEKGDTIETNQNLIVKLMAK